MAGKGRDHQQSDSQEGVNGGLRVSSRNERSRREDKGAQGTVVAVSFCLLHVGAVSD